MIYIVIPVFNRLNYTKACINSLKCQNLKDFKIIVVDHGSSDGTAEYVEHMLPEVHLVLGDETMWWTAATNLGVKKAIELSESDKDFVLTLNNDLVVNKFYLEELIIAHNSTKPAIIGSVSVDINNRSKVYYTGTLWNKINAKYNATLDPNLPLETVQKTVRLINTDLLPGRGVLIPIKCFKEFGLYDNENFPHYMADEDFSLRCKRKGFELFVASRAVVYSHINETGLKDIPKLGSLNYWRKLLFSIKSPNNIVNRWRWAKINTPIPYLYFIFDVMRLTVSQFKQSKNNTHN